MVNEGPVLVSTLSGEVYPFDRIEELSETGESLEVIMPHLEGARIGSGAYLWERFSDFLPFAIDESISLGEGNTPLVAADKRLQGFTGLRNLFLKNETINPTWSFKDRGSLTCIAMARHMGEPVTATISTGNMGHSMAAYGARAGIGVIVFVPGFVPREKILAMGIHGAQVVALQAPDYSAMKKTLLDLAKELGLRIVSGNGPMRVEGYKLTSFEMFEEMEGSVPDYIAVPTSACGHIRGLFKGYRELKEAGIIDRLPGMVVVQAEQNSPIVTAIKEGKQQVVPFTDVHTIAEAITSGNPPGGDEIVQKAQWYGWPAEDVSEEQILESQRVLAESGFFVEPASAVSLWALRKLRREGRIEEEATVIMMLTGSGLKDFDVFSHHRLNVTTTTLDDVAALLRRIM